GGGPRDAASEASPSHPVRLNERVRFWVRTHAAICAADRERGSSRAGRSAGRAKRARWWTPRRGERSEPIPLPPLKRTPNRSWVRTHAAICAADRERGSSRAGRSAGRAKRARWWTPRRGERREPIPLPPLESGYEQPGGPPTGASVSWA